MPETVFHEWETQNLRTKRSFFFHEKWNDGAMKYRKMKTSTAERIENETNSIYHSCINLWMCGMRDIATPYPHFSCSKLFFSHNCCHLSRCLWEQSCSVVWLLHVPVYHLYSGAAYCLLRGIPAHCHFLSVPFLASVSAAAKHSATPQPPSQPFGRADSNWQRPEFSLPIAIKLSHTDWVY